MKKVFLLLSLFSVIGLQAQITINQNQMPGIGDSFIQLIDTAVSTAHEQTVFANGTNFTWDFSALGVHDTIGYNFIDASTTPYAAMFPNADLSIQMSDSAYLYFGIDANKAEILGMVGSYDTIDFQVLYSDPDVIYQFPYTMGTSFFDTYSGSFTEHLGYDPGVGFVVDSVRYTDSHYESQEVIGWGTVSTVMGNFDVLKTMIIDTNITQIEAFAMMVWIPFSADTSISCRYQWNMRNTGLPLIETEYSIDPSDSTINEISWLLVMPALSIEEVEALNMQVYPNPASEVISVELEGISDFYIRITDAQGRIVMESDQAEGNVAAISVNDLNSGMYFVTAILNDQIIGSETFVKE